MVRIHATGDWPPGRVTQAWVADGRRRLPEVDAAIDAAWAAAAARPGIRLFDGPMCRLERWHASPDRLHLELSPTSYKPFLGTNMANPHLAERFGTDVMANPVGVSAVVATADGFLLLGRRNGSVAYYPGWVHCFAGCLEPTDGDVFAAVRRELHEELALTDADVIDVRCTGLVEDLSLRQRELVFAVSVRSTRLAVTSHLDSDEHAAVWFTPVDLASIGKVMDGRSDRLTPVAVASLLLWGQRAFPPKWADESWRRLVQMPSDVPANRPDGVPGPTPEKPATDNISSAATRS